MTFLNAPALWGLLALSIPIIVHFFNLRRPRQILFSNVALVREVSQEVVRRVRFRQWLLLLARLLAIAGLVLAFARPVLTGESQPLRRGSKSIVLIVDNSFSMLAANEKGAYFNQGLSLSRQIIEAYPSTDEFLVMGSADLLRNYNFSDQKTALESLREIEPAQNARSLKEILEAAPALFARSSHPLHELYLISDFQSSTVLSDSLLTSAADSSLRVKLLPLADREQENLFLSGHQIKSKILEVGKPATMQVTVVNDGRSPVNDLSIRVLLNDKAAAISTVNLEPQTSQQIELNFTPDRGGWQNGYIEIEDNPIDFDNRRYFSLYVPQQEKILLVEGAVSSNLRVLYTEVLKNFDTRVVSLRDISTVKWNDYRGVILAGVDQLSTGLIDQLATYLEEGGGLLVIPGPEMQPAQINPFYQRLGAGQFGDPVSAPAGIPAGQADLDHPLFEGIFATDQKNANLDAPTIYQYFTFDRQGNRVQATILSLENGNPILWETGIGDGRLFTLATALNDGWTDLHVRTLFTPLMFRLTQVMSRTGQSQDDQVIGKESPLVVAAESNTLIQMVGNKDQAYIPEQFPRGGAVVLNFEKLEIAAGNYRVIQGDSLLRTISFNIGDTESRLAHLEKDELESLIDAQGMGEMITISQDAGEDLARQISMAQEGIPIWKYFVWLAILMLLAEVALLTFQPRPSSEKVLS